MPPVSAVCFNNRMISLIVGAAVFEVRRTFGGRAKAGIVAGEAFLATGVTGAAGGGARAAFGTTSGFGVGAGADAGVSNGTFSTANWLCFCIFNAGPGRAGSMARFATGEAAVVFGGQSSSLAGALALTVALPGGALTPGGAEEAATPDEPALPGGALTPGGPEEAA
jgi:hypothetical protein